VKLPTLSVVVPNYNHAHYLPVCLSAILNQSVPALEVIVIDDASTDNSVGVMQAFAQKHPSLRFYRNDQNRGVNYNLNFGLSVAKGDFIFFPGADDEVMPGLFEKSLKLLGEHPQAAFCTTIGDWREVSTGLHWHMGAGMADRPCYLSPRQMVDLERRDKLLIVSHTAIYRREALLEVEMFIPELKWHSDWFALYVSGFRHGFCFLPEPLGRLNIFTTSYLHSGRRNAAVHRALLQRIMDLLTSPKYGMETELIREAGSLFMFGLPMLKLLLGRRDYRRFITPNYLRKSLWHSTKLVVKRFTPTPLGNLYFRIAGYRTRTPAGI
jgi:glycosyltransferase involved in cell wall biosynthesis